VGKKCDRILVIGESNSLHNNLVQGLAHSGFSVALVPGFARALLSLQVFNPDMIILNHVSDESLETCHQLHNAFYIPVILLGDDYSPDIWRRALIVAEADFYVRKPFDMEELVAGMKAILRRYKGHGSETQIVKSRNIERQRQINGVVKFTSI